METKTNNGQLRQFVSSVVANMPDVPANIMQGWIENPKGLQKVLSEALLPPHKFEVWKTVKLGGFQSRFAIREAIKKPGMQIGKYADDILEKIPLATEETEMTIVVLSVAELGFKNGAQYGDICNRAKDLGLELCPAEVGPQLRLQYGDQSMGEWLVIAMEPISDSDGDLGLFSVVRGDGGLWLHGGYGDSAYFWGGYDRFVFSLPQVK